MNSSPFKPLHPTDKKCKCGYIGKRSLFYKHLEQAQLVCASHYPPQPFFQFHGEVPHYETTDDQTLS